MKPFRHKPPDRRFLVVCALVFSARIAFAQDPAADDFERALLGSDWLDQAGGTAAIVNGRDLGTTTGTAVAVVWTNTIFDADQFCEAVLADGKPASLLTQVFARRRALDGARYGFHFNPETDPANPRWEIKYDGVPTAQTRILAVVPGVAPLPGGTLRIEVRGTLPVVLKGFHNGLKVIEATDTNHLRIATTGPVGLVSRRQAGTTAPPGSPVFASWKGGSLGPELRIRRVEAAVTNLLLTLVTATNKTYTVQCTEVLRPASWTPLTFLAGDGSEKSVLLTNAAPQRFYRVRVN